MYKSTPSAAWCKKRLLVTSLFAAIYQTSAIAADTSAVSGEAVDDTSEQMTVTAPAPVQKAGSEHSISARELENKGANDFGSIMRYEPLISATGASGGSGNGKSGFDRGCLLYTSIISLLRELRDEGCTMLVSTHNLGSVSEFCDYTVMVKGLSLIHI